MRTITEKEMEAKFEEMWARVTAGEFLFIETETDAVAVMMPYEAYKALIADAEEEGEGEVNTIETKFGIGDEVWFLMDRKVGTDKCETCKHETKTHFEFFTMCGKIEGIDIQRGVQFAPFSGRDEREWTNYSVRYVAVEDSCCEALHPVKEARCFATREEAEGICLELNEELRGEE